MIDHWWQTETGWAIAANCLGLEMLPVKPGSPTKAVPGYDVRVLDASGKRRADRRRSGIWWSGCRCRPAVCRRCGTTTSGFEKSYLTTFPGYYLTGDAGYIDEDGYLFVMGRIDDIINVAGHRLSTGAMEEVIAAHPDVAECAVVGVADAEGPGAGRLRRAEGGRARATADEIAKELVADGARRIGPVAASRQRTVVKRLPKTRSGKILRGTMQKIADGEEWKMPATIDDPVVLDEIKQALGKVGYAQRREP